MEKILLAANVNSVLARDSTAVNDKKVLKFDENSKVFFFFIYHVAQDQQLCQLDHMFMQINSTNSKFYELKENI